MKKTISVFLALLLLLSLVACGGSGSTAAPSSSTAAPASNDAPASNQAPASNETPAKKLDVDEIVIGIVAPQTGSTASLGTGALAGVQFTAEEINANGGIAGVPIKVVFRDDQSDPTKSLSYTEELIYKENVNFLIGQSNSACAAATTELVNEEKVLTFHTCATTTAAIDAQKYPYSFRTCFPNDPQADSLIQIAMNAGYTEAVAIGDTSDLGVSGIQSLKKYADQYGFKLVDTLTYVANDADLTGVANGIKNSGAKLVLSFALAADAAKIISALDRMGYLNQIQLIGYTGTCSATIFELTRTMDISTCYGLYMTDSVIPAGQETLYAPLQELYDKVNEKLGPYTADGSGRTASTGQIFRAYDALYLIKFMVESTMSLDPDVNRKFLEEHGNEYVSHLYEYPYEFGPDDHDGYNTLNASPVSLTDRANDGVRFFGDIYYGAEVPKAN